MAGGGRQDILNIGGFSDAVFTVVSNFLESDTDRFVREGEAARLSDDRLNIERPVRGIHVAGVASFLVHLPRPFRPGYEKGWTFGTWHMAGGGPRRLACLKIFFGSSTMTTAVWRVTKGTEALAATP